MAGPLSGVDVLDLSHGVAGPLATRLLAESGAAITRLARPGASNDSVAVDLSTSAGVRRLLELAERADVLVESFRPGVTDRLGIDYATVRARNSRLVYCSITAYGRGTPDEQRVGYESLVAARTGTQWAQSSGMFRSASLGPPPVAMPPGADQSARPGEPVYSSVAWMSLPAAYHAALGISAALVARQHTGRGQRVETSLFQASLCGRIEVPADAPDDFATWGQYEGAPRGLFRCSDGRWVHHWPMRPLAVVVAAECGDHGGPLVPEPSVEHRRVDPRRVGAEPHAIVEVLHYYPQLVESFAKYSSEQWVRWGQACGDGLELVRSPLEALVLRGTETEAEVDRSIEFTPTESSPVRSTATSRRLSAPLEGLTVLDLGTAVAGPFGASQLADLGARVVKVNAPWDEWWMRTGLSYFSNRGKQSVVLDLSLEAGRRALYRMVAQADVVMHNLRDGVAERLGIDAVTLRNYNPSLIYCRIHGFGRTEPGHLAAVTDQTAAARAGQEWEDGGCDRGGRPFFSASSQGDAGAGYLAAMGVIHSLFHRNGTGWAHDVDTSILKAAALATASAHVGHRGGLDPQQLGFDAWNRLYRTADGWLCLAAVHGEHRAALARITGLTPGAGDDERASRLESVFRQQSAEYWQERLSAESVPCEISAPVDQATLLRDPDLLRRGWVTSYEQHPLGSVLQYGALIDLSDTPMRVWGPAPTFGQHTREVLAWAGLDEAEIAALDGRA